MNQFGLCPRCKNEISLERQRETLVICDHCGHTISDQENKFIKEINSSYRKLAIGISLALALSFVHATNWDNHFFAIIPLKAKQLAGMASESDLVRIKEICLEREKAYCVEQALIELSTKVADNPEYLAELGEVQLQMEKLNASLTSFKRYFDRGGLDLEAAFYYGKALGQAGLVEQSQEYFEAVLAAKPDTLQVTVTKAYVDMLLANKRFLEAQKVIKRIREKGSNTAYFMDHELKKIEKFIQ